MAIGVEYILFWHLNPTKLKPFADAYFIRLKDDIKISEIKAWASGLYNTYAIANCFCKDVKYPNKVLGLMNHKDSDGEELTEEEKQKEIDKLVANLQLMEANFKIEKLKKQIESQECAPS